MYSNELLILLVLADMHFLSLREKVILKEKLDNIADVALLSKEDISQMIHRPLRTRTWNGETAAAQAKQSALLMERYNISYVVFGTESYPQQLTNIYDPPFLLFLRGTGKLLAEGKYIAVVGTRNPTAEGMQAAVSFAAEAVHAGNIIVSGLAYGIDSAAHRGTIAANGKGIAVLACGVDTVYPSVHKRLALQLLENGGLLISEYAPGTPAQKWRFIQRNRIISGLSSAVVVVEAPPGSGALSTAEFALEQGRDVFFHAAAVSENAKRIGQLAERRFLHSTPKTVAQYVLEGAQIIHSYRDYCRFMTANTPDSQLLL